MNVIAATIPSTALDGIRHNPNVVFIEQDAQRHMMAQTTPWGIDAVQAPLVWDAEPPSNGSGKMVCVIDSGLYIDHEDKATGEIGGEPTGWQTDACGHGTHVAGTIAAADNLDGVVGVAPGVSLHIVKVFGDDCSWAYSSDLINAANQCATAGADIINMSLGGPFKSRFEQTAFQKLYSQGILPIAAAGNDANTRKSYPASYPSVISVAATDENDLVAGFSQQNSAVELAAPGVNVLSTVPWLETDQLTVDGVTYDAHHIENAAYGNASGALADGGLCDSTGSRGSQVVLCERGAISFYDKVMNVEAGGGAAAVIYNNVSGNFNSTLGEGKSSDIVAISLSQEDGQYLVANKLVFSGDVVSTISKPGSGYEAWDGTSMATPHVAGAAALLWSAYPTLTNADIRDAMDQTALDLGDPGRDNAYGYGLVQASAAWEYLSGGTPSPEPDGSMHVLDLADSSTLAKRGRWNAVVTITIHDDNESLVDGATVAGSWSGGITGTASCTTDVSGICEVTKRNLKSDVANVTFTVSGIAHSSLTYDSTANHVNEITVSKP